MAGHYRWKSFEENEDRPEKPRRYGVTEMRGPRYSVLSQNVLQEIFESMGQFVDGLKFSGGSNSLIPKSFIKQAIEMAHEHDVYVSTGDWAEHVLRSGGPSAFKEYVEECKQLGFDTIELNANSLEVPEDTLLRYVRMIKNGGLRAKPIFAVKFNKSDIPGRRNRAFGSYVVPEPRSSEFVEDIDLLIRKAERCLEAGADTIMIDADDVCKYADSVRADIIAKVIGRLGVEKTMFEASDAKLAEWFIKRYGPNVNLYVDHSQIMDLECLRGRHLAFAFLANVTSIDLPEPDFTIGPGHGGGAPDPARVEAPPVVVPFVPKSPVYIIYLGATKHADPKLVAQSHLEILKSVLGSEEAAKNSMIYNYQYGFSGFAAKLKPAEAHKLKNHPEVITLVINRKLLMQTTRTWDYLGLFSTPASSKGLLQGSNMGSGAIIGVIDSAGIWSESGVFDDNGYGPTPKQWKGQCVSGDQFKAEDCNKKLIGAKYYMDGLNADLATSINSSTEHISPRDHNGHGTQVSSTVAGSFLSNLAFPGLSAGSIMRGAAPKAHIAMYKACWDVQGGMCSVADVWKAFDEAINDGVDVLSVSIGGLFRDLDVEVDIAIPALHAVNKGITVVSPAGNGGPRGTTVINISPWIITVAATTLDRSLSAFITLDNNQTFMGQSMYTGPELGFTDVMFSADMSSVATVKGKVVMYFEKERPMPGPEILQRNGAVGVIYVRTPSSRLECPANFPCIYIEIDIGSKIYFHMETTSSPKVKISPFKAVIGESVASIVGGSSSRGPSSFSPAILKPDIAAPGLNLLTPRIPTDEDTSEFAYSGTSMATPVIAGIVALLKISHPTWSPAAIKSAIVTTARSTDPYGEPLTAEGTTPKIADAFDYGGGLVDMEKATDPGLVYDMDMNDYVHYLCSAALYTDKRVSALTGNVTTKCPSSSSSILDINVPSITIPDLKGNVKVITRTVTNVGPVDSVYKPVIKAPLGFDVKVSPEELVFNKGTSKAAFTVSVSSGSYKANTGFFFGSLTWSDGLHNVTIPVSVRANFIDNFYL
ncbi:unnamed protein product [Brassica rapa subsp. trilocularis]